VPDGSDDPPAVPLKFREPTSAAIAPCYCIAHATLTTLTSLIPANDGALFASTGEDRRQRLSVPPKCCTHWSSRPVCRIRALAMRPWTVHSFAAERALQTVTVASEAKRSDVPS
jgi:hypothetical protein